MPHGAHQQLRRVWTAAIAAAFLAVLIAPLGHAQSPAPTDPATTLDPGSLDSARDRLERLEARIKAEESNVKRMQSQLANLSGQVATEQGDLDEIRHTLDGTNIRISETTARLSDLSGKLQTRARSLYKRGPVQLLGVFFGGNSLSDFTKRVTYAAGVARRDESLVLDMRRKQAELNEIRAAQVRLESEQRTTVERLENRQTLLIDVFADQQAVLADLAETRAEVIELVQSMEAQLSPSELASIKRVAGKGMTVSYGDWAAAFLERIGAPVTRGNLVAVVAWEASEGTQATWNPLATTMPMEGATIYNSHGVRNYQSLGQGLDASLKTLTRPNHGYEAILDSLERGAEAMDTGKAINASDWCRGCTNGQYVIGIIPAVEKYYDRYSGDGNGGEEPKPSGSPAPTSKPTSTPDDDSVAA
jgi:peptidoglycan hydrolase CwlO-like protein